MCLLKSVSHRASVSPSVPTLLCVIKKLPCNNCDDFNANEVRKLRSNYLQNHRITELSLSTNLLKTNSVPRTPLGTKDIEIIDAALT